MPSKPLFNAQIGGPFYFIKPMNNSQKKPFQKESKLPCEQISNLKNRGLIIQNDEKAIDYLTNIGYFRLSAYFYPLLSEPKSKHIFKAGAKF